MAVRVEVAKVAVIDTATDTMVASAAMNYSNPTGFFVQTPASSVFGGDLLLSTVPDYTNYATGCIARRRRSICRRSTRWA